MVDPIERAHHGMMNDLARMLDIAFNGPDPGEDRKVGFCLLVANIGDIQGGRVNYISNANREDTASMMRELLARWEGRYSSEGGTA